MSLYFWRVAPQLAVITFNSSNVGRSNVCKYFLIYTGLFGQMLCKYVPSAFGKGESRGHCIAVGSLRVFLV
jgi:hypothetical protein